MNSYVVDTHALAWFVSEDKRLSPRAKNILSQGEAGEVQVLIPTLVLAELTHIANNRQLPVRLKNYLIKFYKLFENQSFLLIFQFFRQYMTT